MSEKIKALNELKIDKSNRKAIKRDSNKSAYALLLAGLAIAAYFGYGYLEQGQSKTQIVQDRTSEKEASSGAKNEVSNGKSSDSQQVTSATKPKSSKNSFDNSILEVSGHVTAQRVATVSAKTIGLIEEVYVEEGVHVKKGQALAKLDTRLAELNLKLAEHRRALYSVEVDKRHAEILDANRKLVRQKELMKTNFSNQSDIDTLTINIKVLEANLSTAKTNVDLNEIEIEQLEKRLYDHTIRAPFSGVVTTKNAQPGEIISPSSAGGGYTRTGICTIVDMTSLEIEVDVNESFLDKIYEGQLVKAELYAYENWIFNGRVKNIVPTVDRSKATVRVRIEIEELSDRILPNMAVRVSFIDAKANFQVSMK